MCIHIWILMCMCTNMYIYTHTHAHICDHICLRIKALLCESSAHSLGYKHTSPHTEVQLKSSLDNFLQLEMQFLSLFSRCWKALKGTIFFWGLKAIVSQSNKCLNNLCGGLCDFHKALTARGTSSLVLLLQLAIQSSSIQSIDLVSWSLTRAKMWWGRAHEMLLSHLVSI